jgi:hypothetical protein
VILLTGRSAYHGLQISILRVPVSILPRRSANYGSPVREARFGYSSQTSTEPTTNRRGPMQSPFQVSSGQWASRMAMKRRVAAAGNIEACGGRAE